VLSFLNITGDCDLQIQKLASAIMIATGHPFLSTKCSENSGFFRLPKTGRPTGRPQFAKKKTLGCESKPWHPDGT